MSTSINALVFDLGNVLIHFSLDPFLEFIGKADEKRRGRELLLRTLMETVPYREYEMGKVTTEEFLDRILHVVPSAGNHGTISKAWQDIFRPDEEMFKLLRTLRKQYPVYALSNTNALHWDHVSKTYNLYNEFDGIILSHEVGAMKPSEKIYNELSTRFGLTPARTLFIDDVLENVAGAMDIGLQSFQHIDCQSTVFELERLGVILRSS